MRNLVSVTTGTKVHIAEVLDNGDAQFLRVPCGLNLTAVVSVVDPDPETYQWVSCPTCLDFLLEPLQAA